MEETTKLDSEVPYTKQINCHVPSGFCTYGICAYGEVKDPLRLFTGKDCVEVFCSHIKEEAKRFYHMFPERPMKRLIQEQWRELNRAIKCYICFNDFGENNIKVRDHCHYKGSYRGPSHRICNLRYKIPRYIPVVFHNLSAYPYISSSESWGRSSIPDPSD